MKTRAYVALLFLTCACASSAVSVQAVNVLAEWEGKPASKLKKEWSSKKFKEEEWVGKGKVYTSEERSLFPKTEPVKGKDATTNIEYKSPAASDTAHFRVLIKFYADSKDIIRKWEIIYCSMEPVAK